MIKSKDKARGHQSRLAGAAPIHTSYLSKVLGGSVYLIVDQAIDWRILAPWSRGKVILYNAGKLFPCSPPALKQVLLKQIEIKKNHNDLSKRLKNSKVISEEKQSLYYSLWYYSAFTCYTKPVK